MGMRGGRSAWATTRPAGRSIIDWRSRFITRSSSNRPSWCFTRRRMVLSTGRKPSSPLGLRRKTTLSPAAVTYGNWPERWESRTAPTETHSGYEDSALSDYRRHARHRPGPHAPPGGRGGKPVGGRPPRPRDNQASFGEGVLSDGGRRPNTGRPLQ